MNTTPTHADPLAVRCPQCLVLAGDPCVWGKRPHDLPAHTRRIERAIAARLTAEHEHRTQARDQQKHTEPA